MTAPLPYRPRLADHVMPRHHLVDGEQWVILHDVRGGAVVRLTPREWALIACADGTRDEDGIALAAARDGLYRRFSEIRALLERLHARGLVADGIDGAQGEPGVAATRPLQRLPSRDGRGAFRLRCRGLGACCRQYTTVTVTADEADRASRLVRALEPRTLLPLRGTSREARALPIVDGRCAALGPDDRCILQSTGGDAAKPAVCRVYPATLVDDGVTVRVSLACECACVFAGDPRGDDPLASPLLPDGMRVRGDLPPGVGVGALPPAIAVTTGRRAPREELAAWADAVSGAPIGDDPAAALARLAAVVRAHGLDARAAQEALAGKGDAGDAFAQPAWAALAKAAVAAADTAATWRSAQDFARRARRALAATLARLAAGAPRAAVARAWDDEVLFARAWLFGHHALREGSLDRGLDAAARAIVIGRALAEDAPELVRDAGHPLAAANAMLRGMTPGPAVGP